MESPALISIITPYYNPEKFLAEAINSVLAQTYKNWELLLIDDRSTDCSRNIVKKFAEQDKRIRCLSLSRNSGAGIARNLGMIEAKGRYIAFLDADDRWKPHKLQEQLGFMRKHNCIVCYSSYTLIDDTGKPLNKMVEALSNLNYGKLLKSNYIGNLTGIYDVSQLGKISIPSLRKRQDWALWLDVVKKAGSAQGIAEPLAEYRLSGKSLSSNKLEMLKYNFAVYREHLGFSHLKSLWMMCVFLWEHFMVKSKQIKDL